MLGHVYYAITEFLVLSALFAAITVFLRGAEALFSPTKRQISNWRINLAYFSVDLIIVVPILVFVSANIRDFTTSLPFMAFHTWAEATPLWLLALLSVALGDFVGYWRHRLMHSRKLWPVHAAHHSDEDLTWFSLVRFHPLNRLVAVVLDTVILSALGLPLWAVIFGNRVRHYYGYIIHSNLGWRFGPIRHILVSPFLHRWHHATDLEARDTNFATVFALYDVLFGTFYCPKKSTDTLGVVDRDYPQGYIGQLIYPFKTWANRPETVKDEKAVDVSAL